MLFNWLKPKKNFLQVDLHSHLIPDLDDGVKSWDEAIEILKILQDLGYKKIITTPHIIHNYYPNTPSKICEGVEQLNQLVEKNGLALSIEAGAEYFVDEHFVDQVNRGDELLTIGEKFILVETPFMNKPVFLEEVVFNLQARGLTPILAHPERYIYLQEDFNQIKRLTDIGVLLQVNISSIVGYYSKRARQVAKALIKQHMVHFLGSDIHNHRHLSQVQKTIKSKLFQSCRQLELLNSSL